MFHHTKNLPTQPHNLHSLQKFKSLLFYFTIITLVTTLSWVMYQDYKTVLSVYRKCNIDHAKYDRFIRSDVCAITEYRHMFQSLQLINCDFAEQKLLDETPEDCAVQQYLIHGVMPFVFGRWIHYSYTELIKPNSGWIVICVFVISFVVLYYLNTKRMETTLKHQQQQMGIYTLASAMAAFQRPLQAPPPQLHTLSHEKHIVKNPLPQITHPDVE
jgi:hypothetical protein